MPLLSLFYGLILPLFGADFILKRVFDRVLQL